MKRAGFPPKFHVFAERLDDGVEQHRHRDGICARLFASARLADPEQDQPLGHVNLRRGEPGAVGIRQCIEHIGEQPPYFGCEGIVDLFGPLGQDRMTHTGDLQD